MIFAALGLATITVIIHSVGTVTATGRVARRLAKRANGPGRLATEILLAQLIGMLLLLHIAEAVLWALFYLWVGAVPDPESATYFSLTSYTTVGYGDVVLPEPWRLLGPLEAAVGVLMLGWSTGVIVAVIGTIYRQLFGSLGGAGRSG
jgi:hypothetical protein